MVITTIIKLCDLCKEEVKNDDILMVYANNEPINEWDSLRISIGFKDLDLCSECKRKLYDYMHRM